MSFDRRCFDELLNAVCHGTADRRQMAELAELLRSDNEALDQYLLQVDLHAVLASEPALGCASSVQDEPKSVSSYWVYAPICARHRKFQLQAIGVSAMAVSLAIAAMIWFPRGDESLNQTIVTEVSPSIGKEVVKNRPDATVVVKRATSPKDHAAVPAADALRLKTRWSGITNLYPGQYSAQNRADLRLLPARYLVPRKYRRGGMRLMSVTGAEAVTSSVRGRTVSLSLDKSGKNVTLLEQRTPLWRSDLATQMSIRLTALTLKWRKINEN